MYFGMSDVITDEGLLTRGLKHQHKEKKKELSSVRDSHYDGRAELSNNHQRVGSSTPASTECARQFSYSHLMNVSG